MDISYMLSLRGAQPRSNLSSRRSPRLLRSLAMTMVLLIFPRHEAYAVRGGLLGPRDDGLLEQHVHKDEHRLSLHHQHAGRALRVGVVVLVHRVVGNHGHVAGLPLVADAVVDLESVAVQDVEDRFVHVEVHLRAATWSVLFEVQVERLPEVVLGVKVVLGKGLRPVDEINLVRPPDARQPAETFEFVLETVLTLNGAEEDPVLTLLEVLRRHFVPPLACGSSRSATFKLDVSIASVAWDGLLRGQAHATHEVVEARVGA